MVRVLMVLLIMVGLAGKATAEEGQGTDGVKVLRIGGDYTVASIQRQDGHGFLVEFRSVNPTGRFDVLMLESDHIHVAVRVGQTVRMSAEVVSEKAEAAEVAQVVLFLPNVSGRLPVWMLSSKYPGRDLRATRYLEMHAPATDFSVL